MIVPLQITQANDQTWDIILKPSSHIAQIKNKKTLMDLEIYEQDIKRVKMK